MPQAQGDDSHSKVSTACTNEEQLLYKIKIGSSENKSKRKMSMKMKKQKPAKDPANPIDEETKTMLDNQLDKLVIEKPKSLINKDGKDRSLKEAFLRRPANNVITVHYGPIQGRPPTVFFTYPPFLNKSRPYKQDRI